MRVPEFLQLYKDVTPDAPSDREVTLYGTAALPVLPYPPIPSRDKL